MRFLSVCSGIEACSVAWHPIGWKPVAFSEIEKFPSAVLAHRWPGVPNLGDMTKFQTWPDYAIDLLCGGTPCQSFSVAGLREGLADPRGNLMLTYLAIAARYRPRWLVWENVPGVLSSNGGRDFGTLLGGLAKLGYGFAYRVLDAQYVRVESHSRAVPQRRRRVFVVGCLGDWRSAAAVLFERESLRGNPAPSREPGQRVAGTISSRTEGGGGLGTDFECAWGVIESPIPFDPRQIHHPSNHSRPKAGDPSHPLRGVGNAEPAIAYSAGVFCAGTGQAGTEILQGLCPTLNCNHEQPYIAAVNSGHGFWKESDAAQTLGCEARAVHESTLIAGPVAHALTGNGHDAGEDGTGRGTPLVACREVAQALTSNYGKQPDNSDTAQGPNLVTQVGVTIHGTDGCAKAASYDDAAQCLRSRAPGGIDNSSTTVIQTRMAVRRLTPKECERLQAFPDDYTKIPGAKDGPRYKALGNSMAVNVMSWIGKRIQSVSEITKPTE